MRKKSTAATGLTFWTDYKFPTKVLIHRVIMSVDDEENAGFVGHAYAYRVDKSEARAWLNIYAKGSTGYVDGPLIIIPPDVLYCGFYNAIVAGFCYVEIYYEEIE